MGQTGPLKGELFICPGHEIYNIIKVQVVGRATVDIAPKLEMLAHFKVDEPTINGIIADVCEEISNQFDQDK